MKKEKNYSELKINTCKLIKNKFISNILSIIGLFLPVSPTNISPLFILNGYGFHFSITVGKIPLGWIMIMIAIIF